MELLFSGKMADKTRVQCSRASQAYFQGFHDAYTIFLSVLRIGIHNGSASWNIQHILWLISPFKQRDAGEILVKVDQQVSHYSQIFDEVLDIFLWSGIGV